MLRKMPVGIDFATQEMTVKAPQGVIIVKGGLARWLDGQREQTPAIVKTRRMSRRLWLQR